MNKKKILYILLAVLGVAVLYRAATVSEEKRAPLKYKTGLKTGQESSASGGKSQELKAGKDEIPRIELSKLASVKIKPPQSGTNLFYPFFIKEPPKPPQPQIPQPPPVDLLEEELKLFRFMGFLEKGNGKEIFLAKGQNTYIVKSGEVIDGKFKVDTVKGGIEISAINSDKKVTIPVEEK